MGRGLREGRKTDRCGEREGYEEEDMTDVEREKGMRKKGGEEDMTDAEREGYEEEGRWRRLTDVEREKGMRKKGGEEDMTDVETYISKCSIWNLIVIIVLFELNHVN